jgi:epidermal growth factor receptor substrate 15
MRPPVDAAQSKLTDSLLLQICHHSLALLVATLPANVEEIEHRLGDLSTSTFSSASFSASPSASVSPPVAQHSLPQLSAWLRSVLLDHSQSAAISDLIAEALWEWTRRSISVFESPTHLQHADEMSTVSSSATAATVALSLLRPLSDLFPQLNSANVKHSHAFLKLVHHLLVILCTNASAASTSPTVFSSPSVGWRSAAAAALAAGTSSSESLSVSASSSSSASLPSDLGAALMYGTTVFQPRYAADQCPTDPNVRAALFALLSRFTTWILASPLSEAMSDLDGSSSSSSSSSASSSSSSSSSESASS